MSVVLAGRALEPLEATRQLIESAGGVAIVKQTDVTDADSVAELFDTAISEFGRVDVLVNNAGVTAQVNLVDLEESEWDRIFDTNVRGMFLCSREAGRRFAEAGSGRAVNVASVFGLLGRPGSRPTARRRARSSTSRARSRPSGHASVRR